MTDKAYVFRLIGEPGSLLTTTEATARAIDQLSAKNDGLATSQAKVAAATKPAEQAVKSLGVSAGQTAAAMRQLPAQFTDIVTQLAGGQSPLLVLIQQGGQIKDSFGGIGPTLTALRAAINPVTIAIGAAAVAVGALGFAAYAEQQRVDALNKGLLLTGNYAGVASGQILALSRNVAATANTTVGSARDALQAVIDTGAFGPKLLEPTSTAVARLASLTGESAAKIAADFATMGDGVAKYAAEHNRSMHLITAAQYEQIKALEQAGKAEEAQGVYLTALNTRLAEHDKSIGTVGRAWQDAKKWASEYFSWVQGTFSATTVDRQLELERARLKNLEQSNASRGTFGLSGRFDQEISDSKATIAALERSKALSEQVAKATAESQKRQAEGIAGSQVVDEINKQIDKRSQLTKEIERYTVAVQKMRAANDPKAPNAEQEARAIALLREKYKTSDEKKAEALDNRFTERLVALQQEGVRLDAEIKSYDLYGHSVDKARLAVLNLDIAQGKLKGISADKIKQLQTLASADDAKDRALEQAKANAEVTKSIEVLRSQAEAKAMNARETEIAQRIADMESKGIKVGTEAYIENAASIRTWVDIKHDAILARKLANDQLQNDAEIARLEQETRLLGASSLERQKATAVLKLQAEAEKDLAANPGARAQILDDLTDRTDKLTVAIERNYEASRTLDAGLREALNRYQEDAANQASYASRVVEGGLSRAEDALSNFAKTGKVKLGDLWRFFADEFIRQQSRIALASATSGGGFLQGILGLVGGGLSIDTSGYSFNGGAGTTNAAGISGGRAGGGDVQRGGLYPVNEKGPELLTQGGRDFLMMGGAGGYITPLRDRPSTVAANGARAGSGGNVFVSVQNLGDGKARVEETKVGDDRYVKVVVDRAVGEVDRRIASGGSTARAMASRGVNTDGALLRRA